MNIDIDINEFKYDGRNKLRLSKVANKVSKSYEDKKHYQTLLKEYRKEIDALQNKMYAHDRYGMLLIFQAMDAAGKDGTIRHVMSGVNPHGVAITAFKKPSDKELDRNFLWRTNQHSPARGKIHIFNRSYYEEVLVVRVHPELLTKYQKLPSEHNKNLKKVWQQRYTAIKNLEEHENHNGIHTIKFFLNLSKDEQRKRFIDRIDRQEKNWKFSDADVNERAFWDDYMEAYEDAINATASKHAPWYVIPADDKKNMRLIVSEVILQHLAALNIEYPQITKERMSILANYKQKLLDE